MAARDDAVLPNVTAFTQAPDWACEVVSPTTAGADRVRKMRIYAREAVGHVWLVEPLAKTLEIYRLEDGRWVVASTHVELEIARWWLEGESAGALWLRTRSSIGVGLL